MWRSDWIRLEIFGLDFYSPWYPLSIAYVSLETSMTDLIEDILEANPRTVLFPDVRYTVTARPTAIPEDWLIGHKFQQISLQPMSPVLMRKFVSHWYEAARHRTNDNEERELLSRYEMSLLASISDDTHLRDLADTPLLAGLLCSLNRHLKSHLPRRRSEIYERAIIMFDQRDRIREISTEGLALEATSKTYLLASLAVWMIRNGESEVEIDTARKVIGRSLTSLTQADFAPEIVFRLLLERCGLLREPVVGRVDFIHRTFQEYLAATSAIHEDAIGELLRNAEDVQWREVVLLAAGQANRPQATRLLQGLLGRTSHGSRSRRRLFAISCLQEIRSIDEVLRQNVLSRLPSLLPPTSMDQARELSGAGTRLIRPLAQAWRRSETQAPETIRAASLVGGPAALDLIEEVVQQASTRNDNSLFSEVMRASQYFDRDDYEQRIISPVKEVLLMRIKNKIIKVLADAAARTEKEETMAALLSVIFSGAGERLGRQLEERVISLASRPAHRRATAVDLAALRQEPENRGKAIALANTLLAISGVDAEFGQALETWWQQAEPIRTGSGQPWSKEPARARGGQALTSASIGPWPSPWSGWRRFRHPVGSK